MPESVHQASRSGIRNVGNVFRRQFDGIWQFESFGMSEFFLPFSFPAFLKTLCLKKVKRYTNSAPFVWMSANTYFSGRTERKAVPFLKKHSKHWSFSFEIGVVS